MSVLGSLGLALPLRELLRAVNVLSQRAYGFIIEHVVGLKFGYMPTHAVHDVQSFEVATECLHRVRVACKRPEIGTLTGTDKLTNSAT